MSVASHPVGLPAGPNRRVSGRRISAIKTRVVSARYRRPFQISSGISTELVSLVVEIHTADGAIGIGETSPMTAYTGETLAGVTAAIEEHLAPALIGRDPLDRAGAHVVMDTVLRGQQVAKSGLDIALYDLAGRLSGWPVHAHPRRQRQRARADDLGGRARHARRDGRGGSGVRRPRVSGT